MIKRYLTVCLLGLSVSSCQTLSHSQEKLSTVWHSMLSSVQFAVGLADEEASEDQNAEQDEKYSESKNETFEDEALEAPQSMPAQAAKDPDLQLPKPVDVYWIPPLNEQAKSTSETFDKLPRPEYE